MNRRGFLAGAAAVLPAFSRSDTVNVGLIGCGARGRYVAEKMREAAGVEFGAVCDVFETNREKARVWAGPRARSYAHFRDLLAQKDLDAVLVATPDHWHSAITCDACAAGKHVYVEKPLAYTVREGRAVVDAARRYGRIVQPGMQHRSARHFAEIAGIVREGRLGKVPFVRVWNYVNIFPGGIGRKPDGPPPEGLDWDLWLGPAPKRAFNPLRFLTTYRFFRDYSGGVITDFGTHRFDTVHQIMGADAPISVVAAGGKMALEDAGDVPDSMQVQYEYPGWILSYECSLVNGHGLGGRTPGMRYYSARGADDRPHGIAFYGTLGTIFADRIGYDVYPANPRYPFGLKEPAGEPAGSVARRSVNAGDATGAHARRFIESIRNAATVPAEIEDGHRATLIGHLGNIALATGRKLRWDAETESFPGDTEANALLAREPRRIE